MTRRGVVALALLALLSLSAWRLAVGAGTGAGRSAAGAFGAVRDDGGLRLSISVPHWRFFRGELVPVTLTLSNRSGRPVAYLSSYAGGVCSFSALGVAISSGGQYVAPLSVQAPVLSCPPPRLPFPTLAPGQTVRVRTLVGLPSGGRLTLTAQASFPLSVTIESSGLLEPSQVLDGLRRVFPGLFRSRHTPFAAGGPHVTLAVTPAAPADRVLHLSRRGHTVYLHGYLSKRAQPMAMDSVAYVAGQDLCTTGAASWTPLFDGMLHDQSCGAYMPHERWQVLIGAPGYAVAVAVFCFNLTPSLLARLPFGAAPPCTERIRE